MRWLFVQALRGAGGDSNWRGEACSAANARHVPAGKPSHFGGSCSPGQENDGLGSVAFWSVSVGQPGSVM